MALTASTFSDSLKDLPLPKIDLERLDVRQLEVPIDLPFDLPFDLRWPRLSRRRRRQLGRGRRRLARTLDRTRDRTLDAALERNRDALEVGARRLRRSGRELVAGRPWQKPTFTEQLIEITAQVVAPGPDDPAPLATVRDSVGEVSEAVRGTVAEQVSQMTPISRARWLQALHPRSESSHASLWSSHSSYSAMSTHSLASFGSALSILSAGSILSIGSTGSILSIGSVGSVLSVGSAGSVLSIGAAGRNGLSPTGDVAASSAAAPNAALLSATTRVVQVSAGLFGACAIAAAALRD